MNTAYQIGDKQARYDELSVLRAGIVAQICPEGDESTYAIADVKEAIGKLEKKVVRGRVLAGELRIDGRDTRTVRPIAVKTGILPIA